MKKGAAAILLAALASQAIGAEQNEPKNWIDPFAEAYTNYIMKSLGKGKGSPAETTQKRIKDQEHQEKEANRSERRTVKECIKPGNVIDDDVQECVRGYRERTW